jgi:hypothetical protein
MTTDNNTGKDKEFYNWGKMIFDRIQPNADHKVMIQRGVDLTTPPQRQWVGLTNEEIEQLSIDAGIITWVKRVYDDVDKKFYDLPLGEGMEGDGISLKQFANLVSTRLKEKNT